MTGNDPRYPDAHELNDATSIQRLSAVQLVQHVHHQSRAPIAAMVGWSELLAAGRFGFATPEQEELLAHLEQLIRGVAQTHQDIAEWLAARVDGGGDWISDANGVHPDHLHQSADKRPHPAGTTIQE